MRLHFNLSISFFIFGTLILFFHYWRFRLLKKREPGNRFTDLFTRMVLFSALTMAIYTTFFILFADNSFYLWLGNTLGEPFLVVASVHGFIIFLTLIRPEISLKKITLYLSILGVSSSIFFHLMFPFSPIFDENGILHWNAHFYPGIVFSTFYVMGLLPLTCVLFWRGIKEKVVRSRSLFLSFALFMLLLGGTITSLASEKILFTIAAFLQNAGFILLCVAYVKRSKQDIKDTAPDKLSTG